MRAIALIKTVAYLPRLKTASALEESFDQLLNAYEQIGERMPQLQKYEEIFSLDPRMQKVLEQYYEDILEFHRRALKFFSRRGELARYAYNFSYTKYYCTVGHRMETPLQSDMENI